jgi:hypothetical protein
MDSKVKAAGGRLSSLSSRPPAVELLRWIFGGKRGEQNLMGLFVLERSGWKAASAFDL